MPTYEFACRDCHVLETVVESMADHKSERVCPSCGGISDSQLGVPVVVVKGKSFDFDQKHAFFGPGRKHGLTAEEQERKDKTAIANHRRVARQANRKLNKKSQFKVVGAVPTSLHRHRNRQFGYEYWRNPKEALKREGCYFGDD